MPKEITPQHTGPHGPAAAVRDALDWLGWPVRLAREPGRYLVSEAGTLHTSMIGSVPRDGVRWVFVDAGVYHGPIEALGDAGLPHYVRPAFDPTSDDPGSDDPGSDAGPVEHTPAVVTGPTRDSADRLVGTHQLPPLAEGDRLLVSPAGAYPLTTGLNGVTGVTTWIRRAGQRQQRWRWRWRCGRREGVGEDGFPEVGRGAEG